MAAPCAGADGAVGGWEFKFRCSRVVLSSHESGDAALHFTPFLARKFIAGDGVKFEVTCVNHGTLVLRLSVC